ncbi:MAG: MFS transporter [Hyphomonadaceae bacterium]|nr:MAG: MFS transporter AAHS family 3-hydroxyphenylpropionic acid transporter [Caulobacteraceae bacterium]MBT9447528.1 MFS transporter [Hyphomonadaceae bacterium]TPW05483.1 MAG: MFS transporter, AAHS family, 3-hydroxyphenylpropionic acid transporter [Alphaproteobacteria bacterium]
MTSGVHRQDAQAQEAGLPWRTAFLCLLVTMFEGFDLQILGVIAPMIRKDLSLSPQELGVVFGGATLGLLIGAIASGILADAIGRKPTLVVAIGVFAIFTLASSYAMSGDQLALARFCTGIGLGGAMPSIATLAGEATGRRSNVAFVTIMFAGMPLGGAVSALAVALWPGDVSWRAVFLVGGVLQLVLTALIWLWMPESQAFQSRARSGRETKTGRVTLAAEAAHLSLAHWIGVAGLAIAFFFTLLSLHFFLNWLPTLLAEQGLTGRETALVSSVFGLAGAIGSLVVAWLVQIGRFRLAMFGCYACVAAASAMPWMFGGGLIGAFTISAVVGACLVGAQMTLYGMAPGVFPTSIRGGGVGATIAMGRFGSFVGPTVAGALLGAGWSQNQVMAMNAPAAALAAISIAIALSLVRPIDT